MFNLRMMFGVTPIFFYTDKLGKFLEVVVYGQMSNNSNDVLKLFRLWVLSIIVT